MENSKGVVWKSWPRKKTQSGIATVEGSEHCHSLQTCKRLLTKTVVFGLIGCV